MATCAPAFQQVAAPEIRRRGDTWCSGDRAAREGSKRFLDVRDVGAKPGGSPLFGVCPAVA
jgi:hypothetical protein